MATPRICSIDGCDKPHIARGFCGCHYRRWKKYGRPNGSAPPRVRPVCSIEDCSEPHNARGWCVFHYSRWRETGNPLTPLQQAEKGEPLRFFTEVVCAYEGDDCLLWPYAKTQAGYGHFYLHGRLVEAHREVCIAYNGPPPSDAYEAAHSCGNGHLGCCAKKHLSWKTRMENQSDRVIHGTSNRGLRQGNAKLNEAQVLEIRALGGKMKQHEIASKFKVSKNCISSILNGKNWKWLS